MKNLKAQEAVAHNTVIRIQYCPINNFKVSQTCLKTLQGAGPHAKHWDNINIAIPA